MLNQSRQHEKWKHFKHTNLHWTTSYNQGQKLWEKLLFGQFCVFTPFPNVEKQWAKLPPSYVMGLQHCIGEEGEF